MAELRFVINDVKTGKSYQKALDTPDFEGKQVGEKIKGELIGLDGYELEITGGSDYAGFPMRKDISSSSRKKALLTKGVGMKKIEKKGIRKRKTVCGNRIHDKTVQVNLKVLKEGPKKLEEIFKKEEEKPAEESK